MTNKNQASSPLAVEEIQRRYDVHYRERSALSPVRIVSVAVLLPDGLIFSMKAPARHHNVVQAMTALGISTMRKDITQGFLLSNGRFCRRKPARRIAEKAGQLLPRDSKLSELYSEDVW